MEELSKDITRLNRFNDVRVVVLNNFENIHYLFIMVGTTSINHVETLRNKENKINLNNKF